MRGILMTELTTPTITLAQRREALLVQCALQRIEAARELTALRAPHASGGGVDIKTPLTIAGVVLGMIATRAGKVLPMLTAGLTLIKVANSLRSLLRR